MFCYRKLQKEVEGLEEQLAERDREVAALKEGVAELQRYASTSRDAEEELLQIQQTSKQQVSWVLPLMTEIYTIQIKRNSAQVGGGGVVPGMP